MVILVDFGGSLIKDYVIKYLAICSKYKVYKK